MLIYNTTFLTTSKQVSAFLAYLRSAYIPKALEGGLFTNPRLCRVWGDTPEEGISFSLQFETADKKTLAIWQELQEATLLGTLSSLFAQEVLYFSTVLEHLPLSD